MPVSRFADPTVAIEPPPQDSDFETLLMAQGALQDPFGLWWADVPTTAGAGTTATKSWSDVISDVGRGFVTSLATAIGGKVSGYNPSDPAQVAALAAAREREAKSEQTKMLLVVGGVVGAVVLGALILRRKR